MRRFKAQPDAAISTIEGESLKINLQQKKVRRNSPHFLFPFGFLFLLPYPLLCNRLAFLIFKIELLSGISQRIISVAAQFCNFIRRHWFYFFLFLRHLELVYTSKG